MTDSKTDRVNTTITPPKKQTPKKAGTKVTQDKPTAPVKRDPKTGRQIDVHGLPISGPARARALNGKPDPAIETTATASDKGNEKDLNNG